uniref:DUF4140 domain-containing protein n=1 Tax=Macrostomum lignano TaxID=282301 RepID=A0A1I8F6K2_9PLAT
GAAVAAAAAAVSTANASRSRAAELAPTEELEADPAPERLRLRIRLSQRWKTDRPYSADRTVRAVVIVYLDKAEVSRQLKLRSRAGARPKLVVRDLTAAIDGDSVRVELLGAATITDVVFSAAPSQSDEARRDADKLAATAELDRERRGRRPMQLGSWTGRLKQREVAGHVRDALRETADASRGPYDPKRVATLTGFFDLYEAQAARLRMKDAGPQAPGARFTRHSGARRGRCEHQAETRLKRSLTSLKRRSCITCVVHSRQRGAVLGCASACLPVGPVGWRLRASCGAPSRLSSLRSSGGHPGLEKAAVAAVSLSSPLVTSAAHRQQLSGKKFTGGGKQQQQQQQQPETIPESVNSTAGTQPVQSTKLDAPHLVSIPSDDGWHKVTVASIDLTPVFEYECVPQRSPYAYLKATVTNSSSYALLPGQANIFVDGCFVG